MKEALSGSLYQRSRGCVLALLTIVGVGVAVAIVVYNSVARAAVKDAVQTFTLEFAPDTERFADFVYNRQRALTAVADALSTGASNGASSTDAAAFARVRSPASVRGEHSCDSARSHYDLS